MEGIRCSVKLLQGTERNNWPSSHCHRSKLFKQTSVTLSSIWRSCNSGKVSLLRFKRKIPMSIPEMCIHTGISWWVGGWMRGIIEAVIILIKNINWNGGQIRTLKFANMWPGNSVTQSAMKVNSTAKTYR